MIDERYIELIDIDDITSEPHANCVDLAIDEDESFVLSNGIISHNSAAKAGKGTGDRDTMGFLSLRGVPLNFASVDTERISKNEETFNIMAAMGLKIGESPLLPDGEWVLVEIDGVEQVVNINDSINGLGSVKDLLR